MSEDVAHACSDRDKIALSKAFALFNRTVRDTPAYCEHLRSHGFDTNQNIGMDQFSSVPRMEKAYLDGLGMNHLMPNQDSSAAILIHASSGTSGKPSYWPCKLDELQSATKLYRDLFTNEFGVGVKHSHTLLIVCFGMGTWIAGSYTTTCSLLLRLQGMPLTIVTPGFNQAEAVQVLNQVGSNFPHVILAGIPSFIKDLLERWSEVRVTPAPAVDVLLAGEGFPESWRAHVSSLCTQTRGQQNGLTAEACTSASGGIVRSLLGSADAGLIGYETTRTIQLRLEAERDEQIRHRLFHSPRVPAVVEYDPEFRYIEVLDDKLLITADRAIPLIRYNTRDLGGILDENSLAVVGLPSSHSGNATLYLFGRGIHSATLLGANIHAEYVQELLVHPSVTPFTTGRFSMETLWRENHTQQLILRLELTEAATAIRPSTDDWLGLFVQLLLRRSSEFARIHMEYGDSVLPQIDIRPFRCSKHFPETHRKYS